MRPFARFAFPAAVLCVLSGAPLAAEIRSVPEDLENWPVAATLDGTNVNLRAAPSTRSPVIGRFADERAAGELLVVASSRSDDGFPWFEVVSETAPKGWIFGKHLRRVGDGDDRVGRYCDRVRRDFGLTPAMAVAFFGEPDSRKTRRFTIEDRKIDVTETTLVFHGHTAVYWRTNGRDQLRSVELPGGWQGFGDIMLHDDSESVAEKTGPPDTVRNRVWTYHSGTREIVMVFDLEARLESMTYSAGLFE